MDAVFQWHKHNNLPKTSPGRTAIVAGTLSLDNQVAESRRE